jgi:hypothetical protein
MQPIQSRRRFLTTLSSAGVAGLMSAGHASAQEGPPETTTVRLSKNSSICVAPQIVAEELLRAEGFTDIRFMQTPLEVMSTQLARGDVDFASAFCALHSRSTPRDASSTGASRHGTISPCRRSRKSPTQDGATTTQRTRSGSTLCGCTKRA